MIRYFVLLFNMIGVFIFRTFFAGDVTLTQTAPAKANPGDVFTVEISINKGTLGGFAQMKCEIPEGFTAEQGENAGSEFKFSGQIVRFTWTSLPGDATLKVSYKIKVAAGLSGVKSLAGKFSYVLNNVKNSIEMNTVEVTVGNPAPETVENTTPPPPNPTTTNTPPPDPTTTTTSPTTTTTNNPPPDNTTKTTGTGVVTAARKMPKDAKPGDDFTVEITINKGGLKGFARFQDVLPEGLSATAGETKGGTFSFLDQKAKIVWDNVPADEQLVISYKVHVSSTTSAMGDQSIEGLFSYVENDEPKKIVLTPNMLTIDKGDQVVINTPPPDTTTKHNTVVVNNTPPPDTTTKHNTVVVNNTPPPDNNNQTTNTIPTPNGKVKYKVQICAAHNTVSGSYFQNKYGIGEKVNIESHEGWTKYTTGSFGEYKSARDHRETIKGKGVSDAFVTAYNQGTRITVQEALMISNQQWFR